MKAITLSRFTLFTALVAFFVPFTASAAPGDLYVAETASGNVYRFTPSGTKTTFVSGLSAPQGLAFDAAGNLFVVVGGNSIVKIAPDGSQQTFASGLNSAAALAFDGAGNLYVTESFGDIGDILKFTPAGAKSTFAQTGTVFELAVDTTGDLLAASIGPTDFSGTIVSLTSDASGGTFTLPYAGPGMAVSSSGVLFFRDNSGFSKIAKISFGDAGRTPFTSGVDHPNLMAFDAAGNLFVVDTEAGKIFKVTPDAEVSTFASNLIQPSYLAFEPFKEKVRNISARGLVGTGDEVLIGGFIVGGSGLANNAVVARAIGPSLTGAGVANALQDPVLELHNASGTLLATNDNWQDTQADQIKAAGLAPTKAKESALFATLPAGNYTAVVRGANGTTGVALVEVYSVSQ